MMKTILFIFGTRPEAIKLAPLILKTKQTKQFNCKICITSQHNEMLQDVLEFFNIKPDYNLNIMSKNQTITDISCKVLNGLQPIISKLTPDLVIIQGDTSTTFSAALASYYQKIPIAHIEAGLRTNRQTPFPEEMNRKLTSQLTSIHFSPTISAEKALIKEGINEENIHTVGNTVIDALFLGLKKLDKNYSPIKIKKRHILVTCHRRENIGKPLINVCKAIKKLVKENNDIQITFPVHLNPLIQEIVNKELQNIQNVHICPPMSYPTIIWLMKQSTLILTDSGGIQEEAISLGIPTLVLRNETERTEGIKSNQAIITGTNTDIIVKETNKRLINPTEHAKMAIPSTIYGDGHSSIKIITQIKKYFNI